MKSEEKTTETSVLEFTVFLPLNLFTDIKILIKELIENR
jgi:hypothetical protein